MRKMFLELNGKKVRLPPVLVVVTLGLAAHGLWSLPTHVELFRTASLFGGTMSVWGWFTAQLAMLPDAEEPSMSAEDRWDRSVRRLKREEED